jgi:hypothetical protein
MVLLILIALAQLVVTVLLLGVVLQQVTRQDIERAAGSASISGLQRRTVEAMFEAADDRPAAGRPGSGHRDHS